MTSKTIRDNIHLSGEQYRCITGKADYSIMSIGARDQEEDPRKWQSCVVFTYVAKSCWDMALYFARGPSEHWCCMYMWQLSEKDVVSVMTVSSHVSHVIPCHVALHLVLLAEQTVHAAISTLHLLTPSALLWEEASDCPAQYPKSRCHDG